MLHIFNFLSVGILLCNLLGLGLAAARLCPHYPLARIASVPAVIAVCFCVEHFYAFGDLFYLWPLLTALSLYLIRKHCAMIRQHWAFELCLAASFFYVLAWRYAFPDIDSSSERITNLSFIATYLKGGLLPPDDFWLPPYKLNFYYTFQHYGAALLGRIMGLDAGMSYNLSFCTVAALTISGAYATIANLATSRFARGWALAAFVVGGTGATLVVHFMIDRVPDLWSGMRFIGDSTKPDYVNTAFGKAFVAASYVGTPTNPVKMPMENFAYLMTLGDFHAPLGGLLLMTLGMLAITRLNREPEDRCALGVLVGSAPLMLAVNTWLLPLQSLMVAAYLAYAYYRNYRIDWLVILASGIVTLCLIFPFLRGFALQALDFKTSLRLVPASDRTPLLPGLTLHWPQLVLLLLGIYASFRSHYIAFFTLLLGIQALVSEFLFVDDIYSGEFNRFNTTLKWWPYVQAGTFIGLVPLLLEQSNRFVRYTCVVTLVYLCSYAWDLTYHWVTTPKTHLGRLDGTAWLTDDSYQKVILDLLEVAPPGIVLERLPAGGFTYAPALAMFSGHSALLGWSGHEQLWRGYRSDILTLYNEIEQFYKGSKTNSRDWLQQHDVKFIVWLDKDNIEPFTAFDAIQTQIGADYAWKELHSADKRKIGVWTRR